MNNPVIVLFNKSPNRSSSIFSWQKWAKKYEYPIYTIEHTSSDFVNKYSICNLLKEQNIKYDSILMVSDSTIVTPDCGNFIKDLNNLSYSRWFGPYGNLFEILSLFENKIVSIDDWINSDVVFFTKLEIETLTNKIYNSNLIDIINKNFNSLVNYNELFDIPINLVERNLLKETQLSYSYNMCNMHINELLTNDLKFTKLNPFIVNFNGLDEQSTINFLNETFKYYYTS